MEFFIRKDSTEPILKLKLVDDGKNDKSSFNDMLENASIIFDMLDIKTQEYKILNGVCNITTRTKKFDNTTDEYYITYRFQSNETSTLGRYEGIVTIQFYDSVSSPTTKLILPIKEKLYINIV